MNKFIAKFCGRILLLILAFEALANLAKAQDPGLPDSVILAGDTIVAYNPGMENYYDLNLYCITDDSILFLNLPLEWSGDGWHIYPLQFLWQNTFGLWENRINYPGIGSNNLSLNIGVGLGHNGPPLYTGYQRELGLIIRFGISPFALPQTVVIDTATDPVSGRIEMANLDITFRPKFKGARFRYGVPGQGVGDENRIPEEIAIGDCFPNPFNGSTKIELELSETTRCRVIIYDILGREIAYLIDGEFQAGQYSVVWDGKDKLGGNSGSGVYFVKLVANEKVQTRRLTLIR